MNSGDRSARTEQPLNSETELLKAENGRLKEKIEQLVLLLEEPPRRGARPVEKMPTINTGEVWVGDVTSPKSAAGDIEGDGNASARLGQAEQLVKELEPEPESPDAGSVPQSQQNEPGEGATQIDTEKEAETPMEQNVEPDPDVEQQAEAEVEPEPDLEVEQEAEQQTEQAAEQEAEQQTEQEVVAEPEPEPEPAVEIASNSRLEP